MKKKVLIILGIVIFIIVCLWIYIKEKNSDYTEEEYLSNVNYEISSKFNKSKYSDGYYSYHGENISCNFNITTFNSYSYRNGSDYLKDSVIFTLNDRVSDVSEVDLNGYKWYYMNVSKNGNVSYYYATIRNDIGYIFEYDIRDYLNGDSVDREDFCYSEYDRVISTIKFN